MATPIACEENSQWPHNLLGLTHPAWEDFMAKIKIKEGSCHVWHVGEPGKKITDKDHKRNTEIKIEFPDFRTKYSFKKGMLVSASVPRE